jgi:broad specificity phosphatase PhoE
MLRILLIRHGTTELLGRVLYGRMPNIGLSKGGVEEAQRLAAVLRRRAKLDEIISSPMERAVQTAQPIAETHNLPLQLDAAFTEVDFGDWMGKTFSELHGMEAWKHYNRTRSLVSPPGGESILELQARAWKSIEARANRYSQVEVNIAIVSHGDVIRGLLMLFLGMSADHMHRFEISPASVSEVLLQGSHPTVLSMNEMFWVDC